MKKVLFIVIVCILGITVVLKDQAKESKIDHTIGSAKAIILIEAETGKVLYEENSKEAYPIASMSKMMTQYLVLNAIENGTLKWESMYIPSEYVLQTFGNPQIVKLGMIASSTYTVKELFMAMTVISANDAAVALAELVSGTEEAFVALMNEQAKAFDLKNTKFFNATGLDGNNIEETNSASAKDVATIAQKLLAKHPSVLDFSKVTDFTTSSGQRLWSTNLMLPGMPDSMAGIDGLKTGFTDEAGDCFTSTGIFGGRRVISVVMNAESVGEDHIHPKFTLTREVIEKYAMN